MRSQTVENRLERLETRVTMLEQLPARIDNLASQIVELRTEMHAEFSAVGREIGHLQTGLRGEMADLGAALRGEMTELRNSLRGEITDLGTQMRVLHEEVLARFALLDEGRSGRPPARNRGTRRKAR
jgi:uncharacterized coiled-coil protein SlyX